MQGGVPTREQAITWFNGLLNELKTQAPDHYGEIVRYFLLESLDRNWKELV